MKNIAQIKDNISSFLEAHNVAAAYLFGSTVEGYTIPGSDIDIGVLFKDKSELSQELSLSAKLTLAIGTDVDIVNLKTTSLNLAFRIVSTGILIFEKELSILSDYLETLFCQYQDFRCDFDFFLQEYNQSLQEAYLHG